MKKINFFTVVLVMVGFFAGLHLAFGEQKTIALPKGTKVEKLGPGHFKFLLPNKQVVEVKDFDPKTGAIGYVGIIGDTGIIDPNRPGIVAKGKQGKLKQQAKAKPVRVPVGTEYVIIGDEIISLKAAPRLPKKDYAMIEDDISWLPATILFQIEDEPGW